jgi:CcmD family protein
LEGGLLGFLEKNAIYIVMLIVLVIWLGIFLFVNNTDKRLKAIEKEIASKEN